MNGKKEEEEEEGEERRLLQFEASRRDGRTHRLPNKKEKEKESEFWKEGKKEGRENAVRCLMILLH